QKKLNLPQAIDIALQNNLQVHASNINVDIQNQLKGTRFDLPKTDFGANVGQFNSKNIDQYYNVSQSFNPFSIGPRKKLLSENVKSAELKRSFAQQEIIMQVRQAWNNIMYHEKLNQIMMEQDSLLTRHVKAVNLKYKTGEASQLEQIMSITRKEEFQQKINQNLTSINIEKMKLNILLQLKQEFTFDLVDYVALDLFDVTDVSSLDQNPVTLMALQDLKLAGIQISVEKAQMKPEFSVGYFIQSLTGNQEINNQIIVYDGTPRFQGATVGVSIPIFSLGSNKAKISALKTNVLLQQKNVEMINQNMLFSYSQLLEQLNLAKNKLEYFEKIANPNAEIIIRNADTAYTNGDISYIEFMQGIQMARDIKLDYYASLNQYNQIVINLQYLFNK
ncbi:MAG: TolC family protein, partial [Saprospiraceae bacterium]